MDKQKAIYNLLNKWVSNIIDRKNLEEKLNSWKRLRIKFGIDPTWSQVHIGHAVPILKLREFQKLWHQIVLIIWDSTGQVWDTSDKIAERPMLTRRETRQNASDYLSQFWKIIDVNKTEVRYNSEWIDAINFNQVWELAKNFSVAQMLDRDNFSNRYKSWVRISLQEFLYPIMQWYDSVAINADVELGWNDQYFNLLAGRVLQEASGQPKQDIMTFNLIEWTDGRKMSKTYKNYIWLDFSAIDMFVKFMEINDDLIIPYFENCSTLYLDEIQKYQDRLDAWENPREVKLELASIITWIYHSSDEVEHAKSYFLDVISHWLKPSIDDIEKIDIDVIDWQLPLVSILVQSWLCKNSSEARDILKNWSVKVDDIVQYDTKFMIKLDKENYTLIQVWKKKFKMVR